MIRLPLRRFWSVAALAGFLIIVGLLVVGVGQARASTLAQDSGNLTCYESLCGEQDPAFAISPVDGQVAQVKSLGSSSTLVIFASDGQEIVLVESGAQITNLTYSLDGRYLLYQDNRNGSWDLFSYDLITGEETQLTTDPMNDTYPVFVPGTNTIIYTSNRDGTEELYLLDLDTLDEQMLTTGMSDSILPSVGTDKRTVVYQNNRNGSWDIFLLDLVSGESTQLTTDLYDDSDVCVIQESGWIAFQNNSTGSERTHLLNVETLEEIPLGSTCENLDQARTILSCEQIGDGLYSWTERVSVNVNDIKVRDTFAGPVVGAWQPGCPDENAPTCGDGTCSAPSENSDLCPADCACVDDGVCRPGEGSTCRDCIGGELACGVACPEGVCPAGLACSPQGFCWNDTLCASDPPPQDEPEGSGPVSLPPIETLESSYEECVGEDCAYYDESSLTGAAGGGNLAAPLGVGVVLILAGGGLIYLLRRK